MNTTKPVLITETINSLIIVENISDVLVWALSNLVISLKTTLIRVLTTRIVITTAIIKTLNFI